MNVVDNILRNNKTKKRKCKYCGEVHQYAPFTDCHDPSQPIPDSLEDGYRQTGWR